MVYIQIGGSKVPHYGTLTCSKCKGKKMEKTEMSGVYVSWWKCKDCGHIFVYDQSPKRPNKSKEEPKGYDPYGLFKRGINKPW